MKTLPIAIIILGMLFTIFTIPTSNEESCADLQSSYVKMDGGLNANWRITGQSITFNGNIQSMEKSPLKGELLLYSEPAWQGRWQITSHDPTNNTFEIPPNSEMRYSLTAQALLPGKYHIYPAVHLFGIGQTTVSDACTNNFDVTIVGKTTCAQNLVPISKAEDSSYYCVKPSTAKLLLQRGWASDTFLATIGSGVSGAEYGNGTWTASYVVDVDIGNFDNDTSPVHLQTLYHNGTVYKDDTIPASQIPSDGIYQYPITVKGDNWASGNQYFSLLISYHNKTQTVILSQPPPHP
ncbi:MAG: hypothetical protein ACREBB_04980 [Nitrosotalea sp.]